jgi:uncharacterized protein YggE
VRITGVKEATEQSFNYQPVYRSMMAMEEKADGGAPTPIAPGEIDVRAGVTVKYTIG